MGLPAPAYVSSEGKPAAGDKANAVVSGTLTAIGPGRSFPFMGPFNVAIWGSINTTLTTTAGSLTATVGSATGIGIGNAVNSVNVPPGTTFGNLVGTTATLALAPISMPVYEQTNSDTIRVPTTAGLVGATVSGPGIPTGTTVLAIAQAAGANVTSNQPFGAPIQAGLLKLSNTITVPPIFNQDFPSLTFAPTGNYISVTGADTAATFTGAAVTYSATTQIERSFDGGQTWLLCNVGGSGSLAQYTAGTPLSLSFGEPEMAVQYRVNCIAFTSGTINYRMSTTGGAAQSLRYSQLA